MIVFYKTNKLSYKDIEPVEVEKATEKSVWVYGGRRDRCGFDQYWPTWLEAKQYLLEQAQARALRAVEQLKRAQDDAAAVEALQYPYAASTP